MPLRLALGTLLLLAAVGLGLAQRIHGAVWMTAAAATAEFIRGAFARDFRLRCQALKVAGVRLFGHSPQRLRPCGLQVPGDAAEQIGFWTGSGEGDAQAGCGLRDASGDLEQSCA